MMARHASPGITIPGSRWLLRAFLKVTYDYPGIEAVKPDRAADGDKQFVALHKSGDFPEVVVAAADDPPKKSRRRWLIIGAIALLIVLAAILIPVGLLVIGKDSNDDIPAPSPTSTSTSIRNPDAILPGTALDTMSNGDGDIFIFFQTGDGKLRYSKMDLSPRKSWQGTYELPPVTDTKLGTPLACARTGRDESEIWWLFYVDESNIIQNVYSEGNDTAWSKGTVGDEEYEVPDRRQFAFAVNRGKEWDPEARSVGGGLSLYASDTDVVVQEYIYDDDEADGGSWMGSDFSFPRTDGFSDVDVWSLFQNKTFLMSFSDSERMQFWWRDYFVEYQTNAGDIQADDDDDDASADEGLTWHLGPRGPVSAMRNTTMCLDFNIAFQAADGEIKGTSFSSLGNPPQTRWDEEFDISDGETDGTTTVRKQPIAGTAITCWFFFPRNDDMQTEFHVWYQNESDEDGESQIVEAFRMRDADDRWKVLDTWSFRTVPVHI